MQCPQGVLTQDQHLPIKGLCATEVGVKSCKCGVGLHVSLKEVTCSRYSSRSFQLTIQTPRLSEHTLLVVRPSTEVTESYPGSRHHHTTATSAPKHLGQAIPPLPNVPEPAPPDVVQHHTTVPTLISNMTGLVLAKFVRESISSNHFANPGNSSRHPSLALAKSI